MSLHHAVGKTVLRVETTRVQLATYDKRDALVITAVVFTDGSRLTFGAVEVEHGDPVPRAHYRPKEKSRLTE